MNSFFSNDYVSTCISLAGFILSVINSLYLIAVNSFKIDLIQKSYAFCDTLDRHPVYFELAIENKSRIQVSISRMFLLVNNKKYEFQWEKERIGRTEFKCNGELIEGYSTYSLTLPQSIPGFGVIGGFFYVVTDSSINESDLKSADVKIEIHTNRGRKRFKVYLSDLSVHN